MTLRLVPNVDGHSIEPIKDSWYTQIGKPADLFRSWDYPIEAVCAVCSQPILAEHFLGGWTHFTRD